MRKTTFKRATAILMASISSIVLLGSSQVYAGGLTQNQLQVLNQGIYFYNTEITNCGGSPTSSDSSTLVGADNIEKAYNYFISKGLGPVQAAAIVGNFWWESHGVNPAIEQTPGAWNDTATKPSPPYPDYNHAVGIAQWDGGRRVAIINKAASGGKDVKDLAFQLDYSWGELNGDYVRVLNDMRGTSDVTSATMVFGRGYEAPDEKQAAWPQRIAEAQAIFDKYHGGSSDNGSSCGVTCDPSGNTAIGNLSSVRQSVVCIAKGELEHVWTPLPATPRLEYTKYTGGWECNGGTEPVNNSCGKAGNEEWCADFASWVYKQAGDPFTGGDQGGWMLAAVKQIADLGKADQQLHWHDAKGYTPVPGDLAIHDYGYGNHYNHVNIVTDVTNGQITLIGGDQGGGEAGGPKSVTVVSQGSISSPTGDGIVGYVSPD